MKNFAPRCLSLMLMLLLFAVNISKATQRDLVEDFLSDDPPTIRHGDRMQINVDASALYPDAPMLSLFTALRHNPQINRVRAVWSYQVAGRATREVSTYLRATKTLWYRKKNDIENVLYVWKNVEPQMLYRAAAQSINAGEGRAFERLHRQGCKIALRRRTKISK